MFYDAIREGRKGDTKEPESELKADLKKDYYKILGVQPGPRTTTDSIRRAFNHKSTLNDPSRVGFRRCREGDREEQDHAKGVSITEAYAVLSNVELRREYDSEYDSGGGKVFRKTYRGSRGRKRNKGASNDQRRR